MHKTEHKLEHKLENAWTLWLHMIYDVDWTINSYKKVYTFDTLENGIKVAENMDKEIVERCMLFLMKKNIKPIWEDPNNCNGGCFSYKISTEIINEVWKKLLYRLIGNTIVEDETLINCITGISISPKKNYCIIKIWVSSIADLSNNEIYEFMSEYINKENKIITDLSNIKIDSKDIKDPFNIDQLCNIERHQCIFKKHDVLY
jgi:hypothetical protein